MRVVVVEGREAAGQFLDLPARLYHDDPLWHDGSRFAIEADLARRSAFLRYASMRAFLCTDAAGPVGRLAAFVNPRLLDPAGRPLGQVGYFEAVDDERVAAGLFTAAFPWLIERGATRVVGPMAGGAHRAHRLMTAGFDHAPFLFEPRSRPSYAGLFEASGFTRAHSWFGYDWTPADLRALVEHVRPMAAVARDSGRYRFERLDPRRPEAVFPRIHRLLDEVWQGHTGYAPLDFEELVESFSPLLAMMDAECLGVAVESAEGRDVGLGFVLPDHMESVRALGYDRDRWAGWLAEPRRARPRRLILHTVAVAPSARGSGVAAWIIHDICRDAMARSYEQVVVALVDETFKLFGRLGPATREYALYARSLA